MKSVVTLLVLMTTLTTTLVVSGHTAKRSDDNGPLETVVMRLSSEVSSLATKVDLLQSKLAIESRHASFLVQFHDVEVTTPSSGPYKFNRVIFNDGNGYDPILGVFTAPFAGVYVISVQLTMRGAQSLHPVVDLVSNGNVVDRMAFDLPPGSSGHENGSGSSTFSVKLKAGDKVWLQALGERVFSIYGVYHSHFSGSLVSAE